tara:strand:+ start:416 stop:1021 length:606 start_codon:yes stop_codon:yes gene_type:complete
MKKLIRPLVLLHGLWDDPKIFNTLIEELGSSSSLIFAPHLPHSFGRTTIRSLSKELNRTVLERFGSHSFIDICGFSMGGLVARYWLQDFSGYKRTKRFFSIGSPHKGTLTALPIPKSFFEGIADMKVGSRLIKDLDAGSEVLKGIYCRSYYCFSDLMVFPWWHAILPFGTSRSLPVLTHKALIANHKAIEEITYEFLSVNV